MNYMENLNISEISRTRVKELLRKRLQKPDEYIGKPLIIWRAYYFDGIQEQLVKEVLRERNSGLPKEEWKGVLVNPKTARKERLAFVAVDTLADYDKTLAEFADIPLVVYAAMPSPEESILADFPNAEQYIFTPDYEEWAERFAASAKNYRFLLDFIEHGESGEVEDITYRWYNYFNAGCRRRLMANGEKPEGHTGCDFPSCWQLALSRLRMAMKIARVKKFCDVSDDDFKLVFPPGISGDLVAEFRNYLKAKEL